MFLGVEEKDTTASSSSLLNAIWKPSEVSNVDFKLSVSRSKCGLTGFVALIMAQSSFSTYRLSCGEVGAG